MHIKAHSCENVSMNTVKVFTKVKLCNVQCGESTPYPRRSCVGPSGAATWRRRP